MRQRGAKWKVRIILPLDMDVDVRDTHNLHWTASGVGKVTKSKGMCKGIPDLWVIKTYTQSLNYLTSLLMAWLYFFLGPSTCSHLSLLLPFKGHRRHHWSSSPLDWVMLSSPLGPVSGPLRGEEEESSPHEEEEMANETKKSTVHAKWCESSDTHKEKEQEKNAKFDLTTQTASLTRSASLGPGLWAVKRSFKRPPIDKSECFFAFLFSCDLQLSSCI